jgi:hypothetical protein
MESASQKFLKTQNGWKRNWLRLARVVTVVVLSAGVVVPIKTLVVRVITRALAAVSAATPLNRLELRGAGALEQQALVVPTSLLLARRVQLLCHAEAAVDPEALCAHMNLEISHDLQSERLTHSQAVLPTTWEESSDQDDIEPMSPAPSEEPPVFAHPELRASPACAADILFNMVCHIGCSVSDHTSQHSCPVSRRSLGFRYFCF